MGATDTLDQDDAIAFDYALNLCDHTPWMMLGRQDGAEAVRAARALIESIAADASTQVAGDFARLYVGSYFCDRYFTDMPLAAFRACIDFARDHGMSVTLVLPICGQELLAPAKQLTAQVLEMDEAGTIDEVVANDMGSALWLAGEFDLGHRFELGRGRLMARCSRDPRYAQLVEAPQPFPLGRAEVEALRAQAPFSLLECDPFVPEIDITALDGAAPLALHLPHCYMSTGRICEAASERLSDKRKFRPGAPCAHDCQGCIRVYETDNTDFEHTAFFTKQGRTTFFENPGCRLVMRQGDHLVPTVPQRVIWTPRDYLCAGEAVAEPSAEEYYQQPSGALAEGSWY